MDDKGISEYALGLLEEIERDPDTTQASMAVRLGVAVGTVNWHLKRLVSKGYVKVKRAERRKLRYILTPEGISLRARLTAQYIETSMELYRRTRQQATRLIEQARRRGYDKISIEGNGDLAEICRLTCIENRIVVSDSDDAGGARIRIDGSVLSIEFPQAEG